MNGRRKYLPAAAAALGGCCALRFAGLAVPEATLFATILLVIAIVVLTIAVISS